MSGFIKLNRKFFNHPMWQESRTYSRAEAWLDLMQMARFEDGKQLINGCLIEVKRGSLVASNRYLQERWKWSNTKISVFLKRLINEKMLLINNDSKNTVLTLCNYATYNDVDDTKNDSKTTKKRQRNDSKTTNIRKERKKRTKEKDIPPTPSKGIGECDSLNFETEKKINHELIVEIFHKRCPSYPRLEDLTQNRKSNIDIRVSQMGTPEKMNQVFDKMEASDFISGRTGRRIGSFDWIFKPTKVGEEDNWRKVYEGNYDNVVKQTVGVSGESEDQRIVRKNTELQEQIKRNKEEENQALLMQNTTAIAIKAIEERGCKITKTSVAYLEFEYKGSVISLHTQRGVFSGDTISKGRGIENLLKQLK